MPFTVVNPPHQSNNLKCDNCEKSFFSRKTLEHHKLYTHKKIIKETISPTKQSLRPSTSSTKQKSSKSSSSKSTPPKKEPKLPTPSKFSCSLCALDLVNQENMNLHNLYVHPVQTPSSTLSTIQKSEPDAQITQPSSTNTPNSTHHLSHSELFQTIPLQSVQNFENAPENSDVTNNSQAISPENMLSQSENNSQNPANTSQELENFPLVLYSLNNSDSTDQLVQIVNSGDLSSIDPSLLINFSNLINLIPPPEENSGSVDENNEDLIRAYSLNLSTCENGEGGNYILVPQPDGTMVIFENSPILSIGDGNEIGGGEGESIPVTINHPKGENEGMFLTLELENTNGGERNSEEKEEEKETVPSHITILKDGAWNYKCNICRRKFKKVNMKHHTLCGNNDKRRGGVVDEEESLSPQVKTSIVLYNHVQKKRKGPSISVKPKVKSKSQPMEQSDNDEKICYYTCIECRQKFSDVKDLVKHFEKNVITPALKFSSESDTLLQNISSNSKDISNDPFLLNNSSNTNSEVISNDTSSQNKSLKTVSEIIRNEAPIQNNELNTNSEAILSDTTVHTKKLKSDSEIIRKEKPIQNNELNTNSEAILNDTTVQNEILNIVSEIIREEAPIQINNSTADSEVISNVPSAQNGDLTAFSEAISNALPPHSAVLVSSVKVIENSASSSSSFSSDENDRGFCMDLLGFKMENFEVFGPSENNDETKEDELNLDKDLESLTQEMSEELRSSLIEIFNESIESSISLENSEENEKNRRVSESSAYDDEMLQFSKECSIELVDYEKTSSSESEYNLSTILQKDSSKCKINKIMKTEHEGSSSSNSGMKELRVVVTRLEENEIKDLSETSELNDKSAVHDAKVAKKRGRKRKIVVEDLDENPPEILKVVKKRGRKKKIVEENEELLVEESQIEKRPKLTDEEWCEKFNCFKGLKVLLVRW